MCWEMMEKSLENGETEWKMIGTCLRSLEKWRFFMVFPFSKNDERDSEKMILALEDVGSYGR